MKIGKKFLSIILSLLMIICISSEASVSTAVIVDKTTATGDQTSNYEVIRLDESQNAVISRSNQTAYFQFVPEYDVTVDYSAESDYYTHGAVYDENMELLYEDDMMGADDFFINFVAEAGKTYYLSARYWGNKTGTFSVTITGQRFLGVLKEGRNELTYEKGVQEATYSFEAPVGNSYIFTVSDMSILENAEIRLLDYGRSFYWFYALDEKLRIETDSKCYLTLTFKDSVEKVDFVITVERFHYPEIKPGETKSLQLSDYDSAKPHSAYYEFTPEETVPLNLSVTPASEYLDLFIRLSDAQGEMLDTYRFDEYNYSYNLLAQSGVTYTIFLCPGEVGYAEFDISLKDIDPSSFEEIRLDEPEQMKSVFGSACFCRFTPEESAVISANVEYTGGIDIWLLDSDFHLLRELISDDRILSYPCTAGETYYIYVRGDKQYATVSEELTLSGYDSIKWGETKDIVVSEGEDIYLVYIPEKSMDICLTGIGRFFCRVYDTEIDFIDYETEVDTLSDYDGNKTREYSWYVTAGKVYFIEISTYDDVATGTITIQKARKFQDGDITYTIQKNGTVMVKWFAYDSEDVQPVIPASTRSGTVRTIGSAAFAGCKITDVTIPNSVTKIKANAFDQCSNLKSIIIPASVKEIGRNAIGYTFLTSPPFGEVQVEGFTIYGYSGTAAEKYASDNRISFVSLGEAPEPMVGDADCDGEITVMDASGIQRYISSMMVDDETIIYADVDKNGIVEVVDATFILRYVAGMDVPFSIG